MGLLEDIREAAYAAVEHGGLHWRVRRLGPADVLAGGLAADLLLAAVPASADGTEEGEPSADAVASLVTRSVEIACASIEGVSRDGVDWTPCRLVAAREDEDPAAGRLHASVLSLGALAAVAAAAMSGAEEANERLSSFPVGRDDHVGARPDGQEVRGAAV